ncbi:hypothetical protein AC249_AIPGENE8574, partial [Exaiptasia diaphana]
EDGVVGYGASTLIYAGFRAKLPSEAEAILKEIAAGDRTSSFGDEEPVPGYSGLSSSHKAPGSFWTEIEGVRKRLDSSVSSFLGTLLWRLGLHGGPPAVQSSLTSISFSSTGESWHQFSFIRLLDVPEWFRLEIPIDTLRGLASSDQTLEQPLGHNLFQEAWRLRESNPRTALVIGVSALETGLKESISELMPETEWLLENMPSPSVVKILRELIELLPAKNQFQGSVKRPPKKLITLIGKGVESRNKIVHGASMKPELSPTLLLPGLLLAVRDVLWMLDYYRVTEVGSSNHIEQRTPYDALHKEKGYYRRLAAAIESRVGRALDEIPGNGLFSAAKSMLHAYEETSGLSEMVQYREAEVRMLSSLLLASIFSLLLAASELSGSPGTSLAWLAVSVLLVIVMGSAFAARRRYEVVSVYLYSLIALPQMGVALPEEREAAVAKEETCEQTVDAD